MHQMRSEARGEGGRGEWEVVSLIGNSPRSLPEDPVAPSIPFGLHSLACTLGSKLTSCGWLWIWGTRETHGARGPQPPGGGQTEDMGRGGSKNVEDKLTSYAYNLNSMLMRMQTIH